LQSLKYILAKKKFTDIAESMSKMQKNLENPDSSPLHDSMPQRLAIQAHYKYDPDKKKYVIKEKESVYFNGNQRKSRINTVMSPHLSPRMTK
jgi:hypothetical protein